MTAARDIILSRMESYDDFPQDGVLFRDLTPVLADEAALPTVINAMVEPFVGEFDAIVGLEARGFLFAAAAAISVGVGVVPIRKKGKLPGHVLSESFQLEYGTATFDVNPAILPAHSRVLIMDDVLATGGTAAAAIALVERAGWTVVGLSVALEIAALGGRAPLNPHRVHSLVSV